MPPVDNPYQYSDRRYAAMPADDVGALAGLLSGRLVYTHSNLALAVWATEDGQWRLAAYRPTPPPA